MRKLIVVPVCALWIAVSSGAWAHHSFAVWDMQNEIEFVGVVQELKFRNPHMAMTLIETDDEGQRKTINFTEGAPANMLIRMGFDPEQLQPGKKVHVVGVPRKDDPNVFFLKAIYLDDGTKLDVLAGAGEPRGRE